MPSKEPSETVCDVVVAGLTINVEVPPQTVDDSVVSVPSSKIDSVNEQSALTPKPTTPSETKLPSDSAMTVMQSQTTMASSPSSVLLAKHWGPERLVEIIREPNCSLGISIVGGKVRNDIIRGDLISQVRLKFSHVLKVIRMQYLDCQQILYCNVCVCVGMPACAFV